jgi:maltooligosyltrehalose trehalohydrolase
MSAPFDRPLGAVRSPEGACGFLLWAPKAEKVDVHIVHPGNRVIAMQPADGGYFTVGAEEIACGALYLYCLNGQTRRPDPASRFQPQGVHGPSEVVDADFAWTDNDWFGIPLERYVLYELHVGTFTPQGTFDAIIPRISELKNLGITAIELMPVAQFPGNRNWGYDGVYPFAVQNSYGGPAALKRFVNACHQQGIAVVLDVVYNHLGPEGNYLADFGPYFADFYRTPWGQAVNFDGPQSDNVRRYFVENALRWIAEFHVDALRLDAIHAIVDLSARHFLEELSTVIRVKANQLNRQVFLIAESNRNDGRILSPPETGGLGLDAVWNDDFHHSLHVMLTGEQKGYYQDFSGIADLARAFRQGFVYQGQYSKYRQRRQGTSSQQISARRFIVYGQNHDQVGNRNAGDRLSQLVSFAQLKLAAAAVLFSPYVPLLFMGEEYAEPAPFSYFVSHGDPALVESVRTGRRTYLARFEWDGEMTDPQDESTFLRSILNWELRAEGHHHLLRNFYQELLCLRRDLPALSRLDKNALEVIEFEDAKVIFLRRWLASSHILAVLHFNDEVSQIALPVPAGSWKRKLDSAEPRWGGGVSQASEVLVSSGEVQMSLSPWAVVVYAETASDENKCAQQANADKKRN